MTNNPQHFFLMNNVIQNYAWGSTTSINQLFDIPNPTKTPQAEIWMGAHPNGCSQVEIDGKSISLLELINQDKSTFLSASTATTFAELPYLFKVLAAENALSIQVHPSKQEAEVGFERENKAGIPLNAGHRNYKDPNHKPELVYALTPYQAMNGFRALSEIVARFQALQIDVISDLVEQFELNQTSKGLQDFFTALLSLSGEQKEQAVNALLTHANHYSNDEIFTLILELAQQYPGDIGLFSPLMLNVLTLAPGEAMFLDARTPHAYLKGTGLEIMANSDNVLRAGLTPKHMDIAELASCTRFEEKPAATLLLQPIEERGALLFPVPVTDFKFAIYPQSNNVTVEVTSAEIILPIDGDAILTHQNGEKITIAKGCSVFIPAYTGEYQLSAEGRVARAYN
ncbi:mannose-6-phosphate isomerase, class I [Vibrio aestuarianus]|uniref:mannose-6-phosphate isomerase, class I n=1 Tax=Vibrio aestuarianus TaxID=28171 RepID=UPI0020B16728|nr:mannose-6-phosphate isomerase, class I [Vibrio aestuarianus]MDE1326124.1 mannose-6-phosphate isomerase, class I [Vibrio aestuarianus]